MSLVFITGGTGCLGRELIPVLLRRGHTIRALLRAAEQPPKGIRIVEAGAIRSAAFHQ